MARNNTLRGNVFVCEGDATLTFARCADYILERNVVVAGGTIVVTRPEALALAENNVVCSRTGAVQQVTLDDYRETSRVELPATGWQQVDPLLLEYEQGRVQFGPDSPTTQWGIVPIDVSAAGCQPADR
jgi:hypothetical protein